MPRKVLIALPPAMLEQVDFVANCEHRTRSDLIREALRRYLDNFKDRGLPQNHSQTAPGFTAPRKITHWDNAAMEADDAPVITDTQPIHLSDIHCEKIDPVIRRTYIG